MRQWKRGDWVRCTCGDGGCPSDRCNVAGMVLDGRGEMVAIAAYNRRLKLSAQRWSNQVIDASDVARIGVNQHQKLALMKAVMRGEVVL